MSSSSSSGAVSAALAVSTDSGAKGQKARQKQEQEPTGKDCPTRARIREGEWQRVAEASSDIEKTS
jgi:hypothetical protein